MVSSRQKKLAKTHENGSILKFDNVTILKIAQKFYRAFFPSVLGANVRVGVDLEALILDKLKLRVRSQVH